MPQICDMGQDGFTSLPKEGMLWIFSPEKSDGFGRLTPENIPLYPIGMRLRGSQSPSP
jgi:hypothetical protein